MTEIREIHFTSKYCKNGDDSNHHVCFGTWEGLNVYVVCECFCHNYRREDFENNELTQLRDNLKCTKKMEILQ